MTKNKNRDLEAMLDANKREIAIQWFILWRVCVGRGFVNRSRVTSHFT